MQEITTIKPLTHSGNSLVLNVTKEIKLLGYEPGDKIIITIAVAKKEELNNASTWKVRE